MALLVLAGITSSTNQQNRYAMAASGSRRKKRIAKVAKKKLPKRRRKKQVKIKRHQRRIMHAKKRYRKPKSKIKKKPIRKRYKRKVKPQKQKAKGFNPVERRAKAWIAWHESRNRWYVSNGYCYGKYQLMPAYLHGDYSPANQSRAADHYVHSRYGTWQHAKYFWQIHHWY